ncbi:ABC-F family ATP-binding cassette domain-containing protein [Halocola ammonii]
MNYLSVENISKSFGIRTLFEDVSFGIDKGQKVALVAKNGTGKSSLLKILSREDAPDSGNVVYRNDIRVSFLSQEHGLDENLTILENIFSANNEMMEAIRQYEQALTDAHDQEKLQKATDKMDRLNAWEYETKAKQILGKLDLNELSLEVNTLSGGQKRRIALAKVLIEEPDLLLLDEPTNHLDLDMIEWLEEYLERSTLSLLMVTHDRYFLERVCNEILELDSGVMYRYKGNFSYFLEKKAERHENEAVTAEKANNLLKKELDWMRRQPKARGTKSKSRVEAYHELKDETNRVKDDDKMTLEINMERLGSKIVELHKVRKSYGNKLLIDGLTYYFKRKERVGVVGKNGTGKSTFLNLITEKVEPDGGKVVVGETVQFGYYTQSGMSFKPGQKVIEAVREIADVIPLKKGQKITAEQLLERFLFPRKQQQDFIEKLSGGEKKRLHLLTVLIKNPNFLILDEPTNDLDIFTLQALEDYLQQFPGCLIVVTHDRYFMDKLVDHILVFRGNGKIKDIIGNYSAFRDYEQKENKADRAEELKKKEEAKPKPSSTEKDKGPKTKLSFKEKYEFEQLSEQIEKLENRKAELETEMNSGIEDHEKLMEVSDELGEVVKELAEKEDRWLELSEFA